MPNTSFPFPGSSSPGASSSSGNAAGRWRAALTSGAVEDCVAALTDISNHDDVTGITPWVVDLSGHEDDDVRMWAGEALERAILPSADEVAELTQLLTENLGNSGRHEISGWSATMLGRLGPQAAAAAPSLQTCLDESPSLSVRQRSAWALAQIGSAASVARESLQRACHDSSPKLQRLAREALRMIGEAA